MKNIYKISTQLLTVLIISVKIINVKSNKYTFYGYYRIYNIRKEDG